MAAPLAGHAAAADVGPVKGERSFTVSGSSTSDKDFDSSADGTSGELFWCLTDKW